MDEYGAATPGDPRPPIVVELHDEVVEVIAAPEPVGAFFGLDRTVVAAVGRVFAPGVTRSDAPDRQECPRPRRPIGAPP
jgi:hypothetical protein